MDENRFNNNENGSTQEIDSILTDYDKISNSYNDDFIPRDEFIDYNSVEDTERTRLMDAVSDDDLNIEEPEIHQPVKKRRRKRKKKKNQTNHTRTMGQIFLGVLLSVCAIAAGTYLAVQVIIGLMDFTGMAKQTRESEVVITEDMGVNEIVEVLHENGIIEMPSLFKTYLKLADKEEGFLNGDFIVKSTMSYSNLVDALKTEKTYTETVMVMIPEGYTAQQIAQLLEENLVCRADDFMMYYKAKLNKYDFEEEIEDDPNRYLALEGYLFPDTYEFYVIDDLAEKPNMDTLAYAEQAANKMYANFESKITKKMKARMKELGLTLDEVVTLASLVQWEGTNEDNMGMVASVFHNRLSDPVTFPQLQSDTTYTYIDEYIKPNISEGSEGLYEDIILAYDSYQCVGIPVGPICNPGMVAIEAVLYPEDTSYYYFLASSDGVFYYATTNEEHEQNIIDAALREEE